MTMKLLVALVSHFFPSVSSGRVIIDILDNHADLSALILPLIRDTGRNGSKSAGKRFSRK